MFCHWRKVMVTRVFNCRVGCSRVFSSILWVIRWVSDESQEDLPKFSYRWESTFFNFRIPAIFWLHVGTYCPNMVQSFSLQIWRLWPCFPKKKILCKIGTFFFHQVQELVPLKKNTDWVQSFFKFHFSFHKSDILLLKNHISPSFSQKILGKIEIWTK
jgi:hypothetical protein